MTVSSRRMLERFMATDRGFAKARRVSFSLIRGE
ncbi:DUF2274 domain-containing protein [Komagataeibacter rhaeticus]